LPTRRLRRKLRAAAPWALAESILSGATGFATTLIVARLLRPEELGSASAALALGAIIQAVTVGSVGSALVRARSIHSAALDTFFWTTLGLGLLGGALCVLLAWPLSALYGKPELAGFMLLQALAVVFTGASMVPQAVLLRKMRTRSLAMQTLVSKIASLLVTATLALAGAGAITVVLGSLVGTVVACVALWLFAPRRPRLRYRFDEAAPELRVGFLIGLEQIIWIFHLRGFLLLFGFYQGLDALGVFNFALRLVDEVASLINSVLWKLGIAVFAELQRSGADPAAAFKKGSHYVSAVATPVILGIAAVAPDLVLVIFGEQWISAVPLVQIICTLWTLTFTRVLVPPLLWSQGVQGPLVLTAFAATVFSLGLLIGLSALSAGVVTAGAAYVGRIVVTYPLGLVLVSRAIRITSLQQIRMVALPLAAGIVMVAMVSLVRLSAPGIDPVLRLALGVGTGVVTYMGFIILLDRGAMNELWRQLKGRGAG
jgi:O-antigen/teichoic acid export membrane protein